jgi:hypothetical protein
MSYPKLIFPNEWSERAESEMFSRGYVDLIVELAHGQRYQIVFYDPIRLSQTITSSFQNGDVVFAEPNLLVIPELTIDNIQKAIAELSKSRFYTYLKPI